MASSGKSNSVELIAAVAERLRSAVPPKARLILGLSGGMDSVALLDILAGLSIELQFSLRAVHVNHGISPNAPQWATFCESLCRSRQLPFALEQVSLNYDAGLGLEGAARQARYEALARQAAACDADFIVLAHHRDDQAETLLLHLLRGAGPRGLAGMPDSRSIQGARATLLRPLLDVPRGDIEAHARATGLEWVEDESNQDAGLKRNFLRSRILPELDKAFPGASQAIVRSASNISEAGELLDVLAAEDIARIGSNDGLNAPSLLGLGEARARNVLRRWCEIHGAPWPGLAALKELLRQASLAGKAGSIHVRFGAWSFRLYRGTLYLEPILATVPEDFALTWQGEAELHVASLGGVLRFHPGDGDGLSVTRLHAGTVTLGLRRGGELLQPDGRRPHRTLKYLFQESGIPPWRRDRLPLVFCDGNLVSVPGVGIDCHWRAGPGESGMIVTWESLTG